MKLAVLGAPLRHTRSPDLHHAGLAALGLAAESRAIPTTLDELPGRLAALAAEGVRGVNLTHPLKAAVIPHLARVADGARRARSVNTVGLEPEGWWGETTDGAGFLDLLRSLGRNAAGARVVLLGAGGAARSLALALAESGAETIAVSARDPERSRREWSGVPGAVHVGWRSAAERGALAAATLIVNATPLDHGAAPLDRLPGGALVVDLVYGTGPTPWVLEARAAGLEAWDGLGLLVFQARRSLMLWTGVEVPVEPLARAVGWPR
ncbi:MAG: hypothetical protein A2W00_09205 [Candidatus Eisenbacteria bacterium RBG_16_71_46]|nr:MAG: hypothetical protein A2W00_09205 [Candidatus Eisenbacteria bacterium RBG_16_71_46]OGF21981.1 MAG: hypothetical protein A2V63_01435 [Candidatus Eisenbacteria bacterium RBG_19FT_COMBO_70_11]